MSDLDLRIKEVLEEKGKTIQWLSDELGITYANTFNIVNGKSKPSIERLNEIAIKLNVDITEFFKKNKKLAKEEFQCPKCGEVYTIIKKEI